MADEIKDELDPRLDPENLRKTLAEISAVFNENIQNIVDKISKVDAGEGKFSNSLRIIKQTSRSIADLSKDTVGSIEKGVKGLLRRNDVENKILKAIKLQNQIQGLIKIVEEESLISSEAKAEVLRELLEKLGEQEKVMTKINKLWQKERDDIDLLNRRKLQPLKGILEGLSKIPIIGDSSIINVQRGIDLMENAVQPIEEGGKGLTNMFKILGQGLKGTFQGFLGNISRLALITAPFIIIFKLIKGIVDGMFEADKLNTNIARNLGIQKDLAQQIRTIYRDNKTINDNIFFTTKNQVEAAEQLNNSYSTSYILSKELLKSQIDLTKYLGLSTEEAVNLNKIFISQEMSAEDFRKTIIKQTVEINKQKGIQLNYKQIIQDISKLSGVILSNYKNQIPLLAKAVATVKSLGLEMSDAAQISSSLLDWQSSIENELTSELLLGKELNFERARALALMGKTDQAAQELLKTTGLTFDSFSDLNVIVKDQLAKSIGISTDKLSDALLYQKNLVKLTEQEKKLLDAANLSEEERNRLIKSRTDETSISKGLMELTIQEKFNQALEKAKEIFSDFVSGGLLDKLVDVLSGIINSLAKIQGSNVNFKDQGEKTVKKIEDSKTISLKDKTLADDLSKNIKREKGFFGRLFTPNTEYNLTEAINQSKLDILGKIEKGEMKNISDEKALYRSIYLEISKSREFIKNFGNFSEKSITDLFDNPKYQEKIINAIKKGTGVGLYSPSKNEEIKVEEKQNDFILKGNKMIPFRKDDLIMGGTNLLGDKSINKFDFNFIKDEIKNQLDKINLFKNPIVKTIENIKNIINDKNIEKLKDISNINNIENIKNKEFNEDNIKNITNTENKKIITENIQNVTNTKNVENVKNIENTIIPNNNEVISLLREISRAIREGKTITLDGQKVGTAIAMGTYKTS